MDKDAFLDFLSEQLTEEFWILLREALENAFRIAYEDARRRQEEGKIDAPEFTRTCGQDRHATLEKAIRDSAKAVGLTVEVRKTVAGGVSYSCIRCKRLTLLRTNVMTACKEAPRKSKFRKEFAASNASLLPQQIDMFEEAPPASPEDICAMIIVVRDREDPSKLAFLGAGLPRPDLSSWLVTVSITEILARYHDKSSCEDKTALPKPEVRLKPAARKRRKHRK